MIRDKVWKAIAGLWFGKIVFFSFAIAPMIFKVLDRPVAANLQQNLFPIYYIVGIGCGLILFGLDFFRGRKKIVAISIAIAIGVIGLNVLSPMIRDASLSGSDSMKYLHPTAVVLNIVQMLLVFFAL